MDVDEQVRHSIYRRAYKGVIVSVSRKVFNQVGGKTICDQVKINLGPQIYNRVWDQVKVQVRNQVENLVNNRLR